jgi:thiosulfate dehydrogenase
VNKISVIFSVCLMSMVILFACHSANEPRVPEVKVIQQDESFIIIDTNRIPDDAFGEEVRYGRQLFLNTSYYIGPKGINGKYLGNKMNCSNCHQDAGTKPYSFNLIASHANYPQYRAREGKVLTLAERINNCVTRPHNGKPLPLESREMAAMLSYLKWINGFIKGKDGFKGEKNQPIKFPDAKADSEKGAFLFKQNCARCHGANGEGKLDHSETTYIYPPLWGAQSYQSGSSMHRVIKQAQWLKGNMPYDKVKPGQHFLTDEESLQIAAFVNDDNMHNRPNPANADYPFKEQKAIDYDLPPFADTFPASQHKFGPYQPIIDYWNQNGLKPVY